MGSLLSNKMKTNKMLERELTQCKKELAEYKRARADVIERCEFWKYKFENLQDIIASIYREVLIATLESEERKSERETNQAYENS